ncbi:restriction endonuclease subunit S [Staphylococcus chromogenes]|uniref:restriction endonuclease subunit S n=1 Tax=Staphylococcus chromogenes TaxID=46126 RepID=UPI002904A7C2|nr:restriction endonuclease subunit S [Staphylococcus chromogenes]MDU0451369.1 restriction endonuclease subunit S [Staphylococcus chromogenes]
MEFKKVKLSEISIITMGQSPKSEFYSEIDGTPFLQGNRTFQHIYPVIDTYTKKVTKLVNANDILFSVRAPVGDINIAPVDLCIGRGLCAIRSINNNQEFLFYLLKSKINELESQATGTIFSSVNKKTLENFIVNIPNEKQQKNIGTILSNLDKKIELNQKIIGNLEELSQTLFKRWFVDFEFPDENGNPYKSSGGEMVDSELGEIPKGWNVKNLDDIANYVNGLAMQKFKPTDNENSLPVVKIKELKNGSTDENSNRCTSEIPDKALINDGDIIFSWSATLLVKMWCGGKAGLNQHLFKVSSDKYPKWFYYYWTKRYIDYFIGIANDKATTMGHINRKHLSHAKILIPNDSTLEKFSRTFDDLLEKELSVSKESKRLIELRDTLLPKLMSGEIEIPDDIEVNEDELSI